MNKQQAEAQTKDLNAFVSRNRRVYAPCDWCSGKGRTFAALYGDPAMGYEDNGPCSYCKGSGKSKTLLRME